MGFWDVTTKRILKKLGGDKISGKKYTFDGNTAGKETIPGEMMGLSGVYVKVSNTAFAVDELQSVSATTVFDGVKETNEIPLSAITVQKDGSVTFLVQAEIPIAIVVAESFSSDELSMTVGTYFLYDENYLNLGTYYVSSISYGKETIVPIDPKYLPGVTIDLDEYGIDIATLVMSGGGTVVVEGTEEMWKKICENAQGNIKCSVQFDGATFCLTPSVLAIKEGEVTVLGMTLVASYGATAMVSANIILRTSTSIQSPNGRDTHVHSTVTQTPVPTA